MGVGVVKVLVVEDDARIRVALGLILSNAGYDVVEASSVKTALIHLDLLDLSVVVLDLRLPNGHGRQIVEDLKAKRNDVPVVILSAFPDDALVEFPVTSVLEKPTNRRTLLDAVAKAVKASDAIQSLRKSTRKLGDFNEGSA
jgi:DNA-binding NtrC family response regulator